MPTSAQSLCLPLTYQREPGSSPTSTVPRPGTKPSSRSAAIRDLSSSLIAAAVADPSRVCAVTSSILSSGPRRCSVGKVPGAGEVHGHAGLLRRSDDLLVPDGATRLDDRPDTRVEQHLGPVGEGEERVRRSDRPGG